MAVEEKMTGLNIDDGEEEVLNLSSVVGSQNSTYEQWQICGYHFKNVVIQLGDFIGGFLEYDSTGLRNYMRIQAEFGVKCPGIWMRYIFEGSIKESYHNNPVLGFNLEGIQKSKEVDYGGFCRGKEGGNGT
ncbi:hypothetical protein GOBAR_DD28673 [Gossypium barbadense]|nr:hypothetical protein GOBAR_DD28673 [Gossypium barbadense]